MRDSEFIRADVPMTKEEVRILTLEKLALKNARYFIDVGAGTGSVAIEAALRYPQLTVFAIERNLEAIELIKRNCDKFSVTNLQLLHGVAPCELTHISPEAIFIGGSGGNLSAIIDWSFDLLQEEGRLVLNFILVNNLVESLNHLRNSGFVQIEACQVAIAHLSQLGSGDYFKANNPTYIISCQKPKESNNANNH